MKKIDVVLTEKQLPELNAGLNFSDWKPAKGNAFCIGEKAMKAETIADKEEEAKEANKSPEQIANIKNNKILTVQVEGYSAEHHVMTSRWLGELKAAGLPFLVKKEVVDEATKAKEVKDVLNFDVHATFKGNKLTLKAL